MLYSFKKSPQDFIVTELLDFTLAEQGDFFYILFEKTDQNTMDIISYLGTELKLPRKAFGIAGLKDKNAVTRQRLSIHRNDIADQDKLLTTLANKVKILETHRHTHPLTIGKNSWNNFSITLRAHKKVDGKIKKHIKENLAAIGQTGFPNCFGTQRFGRGMRNFHRAKDIFQNTSDITNDFELKFKLQAYGSARFNTYVLDRLSKGLYYLDGDICINKYHAYDIQTGILQWDKIQLFDYQKSRTEHSTKTHFSPDHLWETIDLDPTQRIPTGPILWYNFLTPSTDTPAGEYEAHFLKQAQFLEEKTQKICQQYKIFGIRRALRVVPQELKYSFGTNNDLIIDFSLPTGAYATTLLACVFQDIDTNTCQSNNRILPTAK